MFFTLSKQGLKPTKEPLIQSSLSIIGSGMLTKLMRFLRRIYIALRLGYYDYVLLLLIMTAILQRWSALRSMWG